MSDWREVCEQLKVAADGGSGYHGLAEEHADRLARMLMLIYAEERGMRSEADCERKFATLWEESKDG